MNWDPSVYLAFGDERGRPYLDLISRIGAAAPAEVVDLGCGPGNLTALLGQRWPAARILGTDNSAEMVDRARADLGSSGIEFALADVIDFEPGPELEVLLSNAVLQWVPGHRELLSEWAGAMRAGSWLAFQVPGNFDAPAHVALREVADAEPSWAGRLGGILRRPVDDPAGYAHLLEGAGCAVDAWETTYLHRLVGSADGVHPVLAWQAGTALRPVQAALDPAEYTEFCARLRARLARLYPMRDGIVWYPFRRIFVVARPRSSAMTIN